MKFLKKNQINFRNVKDDSIAIQITKEVTMDTPNALRLPTGNSSQRPGSVNSINTQVVGQIRYNSDTNEVEVWQGQGGRQAWRSLRYKESTGIVQQSLGAGDDVERFFGPLNPAPPTPDKVDDKSAWGGQNLLVFVENVPQLFDANYTIIQNPCRVTSSIISVNSAGNKFVSANASVINFVDRGFYEGQSFTVTGTTSNNGTYTISSVTTTEIVVNEDIEFDELQGPTVNIIGLSSTTGPLAGAPYPTTNASGDPAYYIRFEEPVPIGTVDPKIVRVLHGFDR